MHLVNIIDRYSKKRCVNLKNCSVNARELVQHVCAKLPNYYVNVNISVTFRAEHLQTDHIWRNHSNIISRLITIPRNHSHFTICDWFDPLTCIFSRKSSVLWALDDSLHVVSQQGVSRSRTGPSSGPPLNQAKKTLPSANQRPVSGSGSSSPKAPKSSPSTTSTCATARRPWPPLYTPID